MSKYQYDLTVIGGGSGGLVAARIGAALGARVCLVDRERLGGDCLNYGCVPSKTLLHAARMVHTARRAGAVLKDTSDAPLEVDMAKIAARIDATIARIGEAEQVYVENVDVKFGKALFQSAHELQLEDELITSQAFVVATGSRPKVPATPGLEEAGYLTNEDVFDLLHLPPTLLIVGGGPVGVELAQAFARLGSRVQLVQGPERVLPKEDPEMSAAIAEALKADGVEIITGARMQEVQREGGKKIVRVRQGQETLRFEADELIIALGRLPNVEGFGLEKTGAEFDEKGIKVNEYLQTATDNIFAVGDALGGFYFTHVAGYQGSIAAQNALLPVGRRKVDYRVVPWVTFTDPEASRVGLTEAEARQQHGDKLKIVRFPWHEIDRAQTEGETEGFIKLVLDDKGQEILGAHIVGSRSGEMLAEVSLAMQHKLGIRGILAVIHAYPTLATGLQTAALEAYLDSKSLSGARKLLRPVLSLRG